MRTGPNPPECIYGLIQNLLTVGDKEDAAELRAVGIECREPSLSETSGEND
jgi:hypothetical protein